MRKRKKLCGVTETDLTKLLQRYSAGTLLALLREIVQNDGPEINWDQIQKRGVPGLTSPRECQDLWRFLAYHSPLQEEYEDDAKALDEGSDLEECEPVPGSVPETAAIAAEVSAFVKADLERAGIKISLGNATGLYSTKFSSTGAGGTKRKADAPAHGARQKKGAGQPIVLPPPAGGGQQTAAGHGGEEGVPADRVGNGTTDKSATGFVGSSSANFAKLAASSTGTDADTTFPSASGMIAVGTSKLQEGSTGCAGSDKKLTSMGPPERRKRKLWTTEEDEALLAAVEKCGEGNWTNILKGAFTLERTAAQLSQRWALIRKRKDLLAAAKARRVASTVAAADPQGPVTVPATIVEAPLGSTKAESGCATAECGNSTEVNRVSTPTPSGSAQHDSVSRPGTLAVLSCPLPSTPAPGFQSASSTPVPASHPHTSQALQNTELHPPSTGPLPRESALVAKAAEQSVPGGTFTTCGTLSAMVGTAVSSAASAVSAAAPHSGNLRGPSPDGLVQGVVASSGLGVRPPVVVGVSAGSSWGWQNPPMHALQPPSPGIAIASMTNVAPAHSRGLGNYSAPQPSQPSQPVSAGVAMPGMAVGISVGMPYQMGVVGSMVPPTTGKSATGDASEVRKRPPNAIRPHIVDSVSCLQAQPSSAAMSTAGAGGKEGGRGRGTVMSGSGGRGSGSSSSGRLPAGGRVVAPGVMVMSAAAAQAASVGGSEMWSAAVISSGRALGKATAGATTSAYCGTDAFASSSVSAVATAGRPSLGRQGAGRSSASDQSLQAVSAAAGTGTKATSSQQPSRTVKAQQPVTGKGVPMAATSGPTPGMARASAPTGGRGASRGSTGSGLPAQQPTQPGILGRFSERSASSQIQQMASHLPPSQVSSVAQPPQQSLASQQPPVLPQQPHTLSSQLPPSPAPHATQQKPSQFSQTMIPAPHHQPVFPNPPLSSQLLQSPCPLLHPPLRLPGPPPSVAQSPKSAARPLQTQPQAVQSRPLSAATLANAGVISPLAPDQLCGGRQEQLKHRSDDSLPALGAQGQAEANTEPAVQNNTEVAIVANQTVCGTRSGESAAPLAMHPGAVQALSPSQRSTKYSQPPETTSFVQASGICLTPPPQSSPQPVPSPPLPTACPPPLNTQPPANPPPPASALPHAIPCDHYPQAHLKQPPQDRVCPKNSIPPSASGTPGLSSLNVLLPQGGLGRTHHAAQQQQQQTGQCSSGPHLPEGATSCQSETVGKDSANAQMLSFTSYMAVGDGRSESRGEKTTYAHGGMCVRRVEQSGGEQQAVSDIEPFNIRESSLLGKEPVVPDELPVPSAGIRELQQESVELHQSSEDACAADMLLTVNSVSLGEGRLLWGDQKQIAGNVQSSHNPPIAAGGEVSVVKDDLTDVGS